MYSRGEIILMNIACTYTFTQSLILCAPNRESTISVTCPVYTQKVLGRYNQPTKVYNQHTYLHKTIAINDRKRSCVSNFQSECTCLLLVKDLYSLAC